MALQIFRLSGAFVCVQPNNNNNNRCVLARQKSKKALSHSNPTSKQNQTAIFSSLCSLSLSPCFSTHQLHLFLWDLLCAVGGCCFPLLPFFFSPLSTPFFLTFELPFFCFLISGSKNLPQLGFWAASLLFPQAQCFF